MPLIAFRGRKAICLENEHLRVTVLETGGHIAEVFHKQAEVSPLWLPHWESVEPSDLGPQHAATFGSGPDAKLLAGIMGHNLCLDIFGGPSAEEAEAGYTVHGEASVLRYEVSEGPGELLLSLTLPLAQIRFERSIRLQGQLLRVHESATSLVAFDRPIAWTQHVTLAPPFLDPATTEFSASVTRSFVAETDPGNAAYLTHGAIFDWPMAPGKNGKVFDLRKMSQTSPASGYTTHLADPDSNHAFFTAFSPKHRLAFSYIWRPVDYPWLGIWEENCSRQASPWDGITVTRGMEFGVSPMPETRQKMVSRGQLLDTPTFRWLRANERLETEYWISLQSADGMPDPIDWPAEQP